MEICMDIKAPGADKELNKTASRLQALGNLFIALGKEADDAYRRASINPPEAPTRRRFELEILTPGGAVSLLPVESLYRMWSDPKSASGAWRCSFGGMRHLYMGDCAQHMKSLYEKFGITVPDEFKAMPDHLALLCEFVGLYVECGNYGALLAFLEDHFDWLEQYRFELIESKGRLYGLGDNDPRARETRDAIDHAVFLLGEIEDAVDRLADRAATVTGALSYEDGG